MTTQYTTILKLALPVQGELSGTWGDVVNDNITQMVEQAVAGKAVVNTWTGNSHTLTTADGTTSESRCAILELTDSGTALTGAGTVVCPTNTKLYIVDNNTAEIITVQTAAGTGVAVPVGKTMLVYCDGTNVVEGVTHANSLSLGTSTVTADKILDEDNMASDSATAIATQQSIKAYVDSQVGTVDTLSEILANGNTTGANDIDVDSAQKVQFRDADIYLNSSVDGQLDIVADTEIQIAATTVDLNGNLDVSGTALVAGVLTTTAATVFNGGFASNADSTLGTDKKVQFRDAAIYLNSSVDGQLDIVADGEVQIDTALVDINGNLDVSGTTNISGSVSFTKNAIAGVAISTTSRSSNTVTVTTSAVHGLTSGDLVNVNGVADTSFNGYFTVSVSSTTVFTYSQTGADGSSTGGTSTEVVYNLNASGTALNWMNGPLNIAANSGIDGLEITQSGAGNGLHVTGTTGLVGNPSSILSTSGTDTTVYSSSSVGGQDSSATLKIQNLTTAANSFASIDFNTNNNRVVNRIVSGHASSTTDGFLAFVTEGGGVPAERMRINANGLVGIGTSSPQKTLDVNGTFAISNSTTSYWDFDRDDSDGSLKIADTGTERMRIDASGNVGIGTSTITSGFKLEVTGDARFGDAVGDDAVELGWSAGGSQGFIQAYDRGASAFRPLILNNSLTVDASGNVGIGVTPEAWAAFNPVLRIKNASAGGGGALAGSGVDNFRMFANTYYDGAYKRLDTGFATQYGQESGAHVWSYAASGAGDSTITWSEAMRIDASGNLLVGKTSTAFGTEGFVYEAGAAVEVTTDSNRVMRLNRTTSDGNIIELNKDGTTVGSIGTEGGDLTIGNADTGLQFVNTSQIIRPQN
jgi:hypothetical protein